jgi:hypothetical protein
VQHEPDGLFATHDHFVITAPLAPVVEQQLLHRIQTHHKTLSIRQTVEQSPLDYKQHSGVIFTSDPAFTAKQLKTHLPGITPHFVDLKTTWSELIETVDIQSRTPLIIKRTPSAFFKALTGGHTVIWYGQMNLDLYQ